MTSSTDLARRDSAGELTVPAGARRLGARVKPIIRLGMGIKVEGTRADGSTYTRPDKTDYFTVRGDDRAVGKFKSVYGEKPKAVKLMVPSSLSLALDISYRAFVGGQNEDGGRPLALGFTNFAPLGYAGGADLLRVWKNDGTYAEVETAGLDENGDPFDDIAAQLKIELYTTFTFTIPDVLGWGSFAQVTSKGKKTADNLTFKLSEIYGAFGSKAPWAFDREQPPMLVIKPDTALTRFEDRSSGEAGWGKSKIYVLDIVIPEAFHDMQDRLVERERALAPAGAAAALYGREISSGVLTSVPPDESTADQRTPPEENRQQADATAEAITGSAPGVGGASVPDDEEPLVGEIVDEDGPTDEQLLALARQAAMFAVPNGQNKGKTLGEIYEAGDDGVKWLKWALGKITSAGYRDAVHAFCRYYMADDYRRIVGGQS